MSLQQFVVTPVDLYEIESHCWGIDGTANALRTCAGMSRLRGMIVDAMYTSDIHTLSARPTSGFVTIIAARLSTSMTPAADGVSAHSCRLRNW